MEKCYIEPDYIASDADDQLPITSSIGRGPRGTGVKATVAEDTETSYKFNIVNDLTSEVEIQSPNLHAGKITVVDSDPNPIPGEKTWMDVIVTKDGVQKTYRVNLPAGTPAETIFIAASYYDYNETNVYEIPIADLTVEDQKWTTMPDARINDVIFAPIANVPQSVTGASGIGIGRIRAINAGIAVTTILTYVKLGGQIDSITNEFIDALN